MLEERRECEDVLTQLMAVRSGVDQAGLLLMDLHIECCLLEDLPADDERVKELREALKMWSRFGQPAPASPLPEP